MQEVINTDVVVIGAGPSGAVAAALLSHKGWHVTVLEKEHFPRFSIGESLLPQCMESLREAGMLEAVEAAGFQYKNGAAFHHDGQDAVFDFREKFSSGPGTTFQVERAQFDHILAKEAERAGASVLFGQAIRDGDFNGQRPSLTVQNDHGETYQITSRFVLDGSGFGRVLPRLLDLDEPSEFPVRGALFTHLEDRITAPEYDRNKILITVHPYRQDVWYWLIPFANGRSSLGVVAPPEFLDQYHGDARSRLQQVVSEDSNLRHMLSDADWDSEAREIRGYSRNVSQLTGKGFALLGNAAEFLDPIFSSGVTVALKSASLAANTLDRQLTTGEDDWETSFEKPLRQGVNTFRTYVEGWYDGRFQDVVFSKQSSGTVGDMIASILAGYAWDTNNPFVADSERRLSALAEICREQS